MRKSFALVLILIFTVSSPIMVKPENASAQIAKPAIPEFTVKFVDASYDVPTTYSIDPYTGQNVTQPSHRVDNRSIELIITNQPSISYLVQEGNSNWTANFYYNVRIKGHYTEEWN